MKILCLRRFYYFLFPAVVLALIISDETISLIATGGFWERMSGAYNSISTKENGQNVEIGMFFPAVK